MTCITLNRVFGEIASQTQKDQTLRVSVRPCRLVEDESLGNIRHRAILAVLAGCGLLVGCGGGTVETIWFGDPMAVGSQVIIDGVPAFQCDGVIAGDSGYVNRGGNWSPCYEVGETIARPGERFVSASFDIQSGSHAIEVILPSGDTLRGDAWIYDSPVFILNGRCRVLWFPSINGVGADSVANRGAAGHH